MLSSPAGPFDDVFHEYLPQTSAQPDTQQSQRKETTASTSPASKTKSKGSDVDVSPTSDYFSSSVVMDPPRDSSLPDSDTDIHLESENHSTDTGANSIPGTDAAQSSSEADHQVSSEKHFREALDLTETAASSEFPLGSYRSQPRPPQQDPRGVYPTLIAPHTQFNDPFYSSVLQKEVPASTSGDLIGLNFSGIAPSFENSFGLSPVNALFAPLIGGGRDSNLNQVRREEESDSWSEAKKQYGIVESEYAELNSDTVWSRAVGGKQSIDEQLSSKGTPSSNRLKFTGVSSLDSSYLMDDEEEDDEFPLRPSDEFVHQSQIENDAFQPYSGATPLLPIISGNVGDGGEGGMGIPRVREIGLHGKNWSKEDGELARRDGSKKSRDKSAKTNALNFVQEDGLLFSGGDNNNGSKPAPGSVSSLPWSASASDLVDVGVSSGVSNVTNPSMYGLELNGRGRDLPNIWGAGNELGATMMASAFSSSVSSKLEPRGVQEGTFRAALPSLASRGPPGGGNPEAIDEMDIFGGDDQTTTIRNNGVQDGGKFSCLLCYVAYDTARELGSHTANSAEHLERAMLDSGAERAWQYAPPPPRKLNASVLQACSK